MPFSWGSHSCCSACPFSRLESARTTPLLGTPSCSSECRVSAWGQDSSSLPRSRTGSARRGVFWIKRNPLQLDRRFVSYAAATIPMDEELFCEFYEQTARNLRASLRSMVFDQALVDDLLQESYFRLLKAGLPASMDMVYRKNYLYRIATNLVRDNRRAPRWEQLSEERGLAASDESFGKAQDVKQAFVRLKPKERELLWMADVERVSHKKSA